MRKFYAIKYRNDGENFDRPIEGYWDSLEAAWKALIAILKCAGRTINSLTKVEITTS